MKTSYMRLRPSDDQAAPVWPRPPILRWGPPLFWLLAALCDTAAQPAAVLAQSPKVFEVSAIAAHPASGQTAIVTLSLSRFGNVSTSPAGPSVGVSPSRLVVHVGEAVVFVNADSRHHTATGIPGSTTFPSDPHWTDAALRAGGALNGDAWSTGDLAPGARSAPVKAEKPGTYLYGCFFDYSAGMRGTIVVEP